VVSQALRHGGPLGLLLGYMIMVSASDDGEKYRVLTVAPYLPPRTGIYRTLPLRVFGARDGC
jgi:hypothetical protein